MKQQPEWYEFEAAQIWALVGYTQSQIDLAMYLPPGIRLSAAHYERIGSEARRVWLAAGYSAPEVDAGMARGGWPTLGTRLMA